MLTRIIVTGTKRIHLYHKKWNWTGILMISISWTQEWSQVLKCLWC